ncbi:MAG: hypothetical protein E7018_01960 [Alphaproteobacteria bacterium]|nr:hypothetical protein [Alphaproteobacteria bacterium]
MVEMRIESVEKTEKGYTLYLEGGNAQVDVKQPIDKQPQVGDLFRIDQYGGETRCYLNGVCLSKVEGRIIAVKESTKFYTFFLNNNPEWPNEVPIGYFRGTRKPKKGDWLEMIPCDGRTHLFLNNKPLGKRCLISEEESRVVLQRQERLQRKYDEIKRRRAKNQ